MERQKVGKRFISSTVSKCLLNRNKQLIIPNKALNNEELMRYALCLRIPFFRGVFMKDRMPRQMWTNETGIVNLDNTTGKGTHWVCYKRLLETVYYFDSFGNLPPPKELQHYFRSAKRVMYNYNRWQNDNTLICGHLCLEFLSTSISML